MHDSKQANLEYLENLDRNKNFDIMDFEFIQDQIDALRQSSDIEFETVIETYRDKFRYLAFED
jgi:hypothetical protein